MSDWRLTLAPPLVISNLTPCTAKYTVWEEDEDRKGQPSRKAQEGLLQGGASVAVHSLVRRPAHAPAPEPRPGARALTFARARALATRPGAPLARRSRSHQPLRPAAWLRLRRVQDPRRTAWLRWDVPEQGLTPRPSETSGRPMLAVLRGPPGTAAMNVVHLWRETDGARLDLSLEHDKSGDDDDESGAGTLAVAVSCPFLLVNRTGLPVRLLHCKRLQFVLEYYYNAYSIFLGY